MEANELRLNNLVERLVKNPQKKDPLYYYKISKIDQQDFYYYDENIFKPIPLTENWLLKFGFEIQVFTLTKRYKSKCGNLLLYIMPDNVVFANGVINDIRLESVHQLQNLYFALTNEELTIK